MVTHAFQLPGQQISNKLNPAACREQLFQAELPSNVTSACSDGPFSGRSNEAVALRFSMLRAAVHHPASAAAPPVTFMRQLARRFKVSIATVRAAVQANSRNDRFTLRRVMCVASIFSIFPKF